MVDFPIWSRPSSPSSSAVFLRWQSPGTDLIHQKIVSISLPSSPSLGHTPHPWKSFRHSKKALQEQIKATIDYLNCQKWIIQHRL